MSVDCCVRVLPGQGIIACSSYKHHKNPQLLTCIRTYLQYNYVFTTLQISIRCALFELFIASVHHLRTYVLCTIVRSRKYVRRKMCPRNIFFYPTGPKCLGNSVRPDRINLRKICPTYVPAPQLALDSQTPRTGFAFCVCPCICIV